ncbi:MAG: carbohydrate ABC transporter permease [Firmicutes bacterium]|nr:carbohydrate ABC transporter permease [Bacillota bacterium]
MVFPLLWTISTALKTVDQLMVYPPKWIPNPIQPSNFKTAMTILPFASYLQNTLTIVGFNIVGAIVSSAFVAYGFARIRFPGRDVLFVVMLSTMMMPYIVQMIPLYIMYSKLKWVNTFLPLIVPAWFGVPFYIFLLRQFFRSIPEDLADAARIDGCTEIGIWWRVMLPLSKPALAVIAIFNFQANWNDFLGPLIYLTDTKLRTLALGLYAFRAIPGQLPMFHLLMAASLIMALPVLLLFFFFQRYFIQGVVLTGIKG